MPANIENYAAPDTPESEEQSELSFGSLCSLSEDNKSHDSNVSYVPRTDGAGGTASDARSQIIKVDLDGSEQLNFLKMVKLGLSSPKELV